MCQVSCMLEIKKVGAFKSHTTILFLIFKVIFLFYFLSIIIFMSFCFSWVYETRSKQSGLTVLEIDIPTGYVIMNDTLRALVNSPTSPSNLKRAEFYKRKVVFYFEYVSKIDQQNIS